MARLGIQSGRSKDLNRRGGQDRQWYAAFVPRLRVFGYADVAWVPIEEADDLVCLNWSSSALLPVLRISFLGKETRKGRRRRVDGKAAKRQLGPRIIARRREGASAERSVSAGKIAFVFQN